MQCMKRLSATDVTRHFSAVLDALEQDQEEIVLVRNQRQVARIVPEAPQQDALTVFADLYRTLDDETADALSAAVAAQRKSRHGRLAALRNPWAG
jgi:antitoxin (DNA-binding transcriptional repressor) of toxin-antitoxin stability system